MFLFSVLLGVGSTFHLGWGQTTGLTDRDATGWIIATYEDRVSVGAGDLVILDHGSQRGVDVGDRYLVFSPQEASMEPRTKRRLRIAGELIGEVQVVSVTEQTAKAIVLRSTREINVGALITPLRSGAGATLDVRPQSAGERAAVRARFARVSPCLDAAHRTVQQAEQAGTAAMELVEAKRILAQADMALEQANALLKAGDADRAATRLDTAMADCTRASALVQRLGATPPRAEAQSPGRL